MTYEIRDDPDDLPIPCATFAEAERRGRRRADRIGSPVLIYEIDSRGGERFVGICGPPCPAPLSWRAGRMSGGRAGSFAANAPARGFALHCSAASRAT